MSEILDHHITQWVIERMRAFMTSDPRWLLASWGEYKPPPGHVILADLVDAEEVVETVLLREWVPFYRKPVTLHRSLRYEMETTRTLYPSLRTRGFHQWGVWATLAMDVGLLTDQRFPKVPHDSDFLAHFTLLRYVERA